MTYIAIVTDKKTGEKLTIQRDYPSKRAFKQELRCNGLSIRNNFVYTAEEWNNSSVFEEISSKLYYRKMTRQNIRKAIRKSRKN